MNKNDWSLELLWFPYELEQIDVGNELDIGYWSFLLLDDNLVFLYLIIWNLLWSLFLQLLLFLLLELHLVFVLILLFKKLEDKLERWPFSFFWFEAYITSKLFDDLLWYGKSKTNAVYIHLFRILHIPKKLKQFILVWFFDTYPCIDNWDLQKRVIFFFIDLRLYSYFPLVRELNRIGLQVKQHLLYPHFIMDNCLLTHQIKFWNKLDFLVLCLYLLYAHDFMYALLDIELLDVLSELVLVDLRIIKEILNEELDNFCGWLLDFFACF